MQDATLNAAAGKYAGMDRFVARKALWADMEAAGLVIRKENYTVRYAFSAPPPPAFSAPP
jgi:valyl-tRNA synthetase